MSFQVDDDCRIGDRSAVIDIDDPAIADDDSGIGYGMVTFTVDKPVGKDGVGLRETALGDQQEDQHWQDSHIYFAVICSKVQKNLLVSKRMTLPVCQDIILAPYSHFDKYRRKTFT